MSSAHARGRADGRVDTVVDPRATPNGCRGAPCLDARLCTRSYTPACALALHACAHARLRGQQRYKVSICIDGTEAITNYIGHNYIGRQSYKASICVDGTDAITNYIGHNYIGRRRYKASICVDGTEAFGQLALNLSNIKPDFYIGTMHRWLFGVQGTAFICSRAQSPWPLHTYAHIVMAWPT